MSFLMTYDCIWIKKKSHGKVSPNLKNEHSQNTTTVEKEHLKVYLRIRPFTSLETENGESQVTLCLIFLSSTLMCCFGGPFNI